MTPTLTVFTPTYNRLHTITRTFESLCRQSCRDFRWLVIDDGSSDGTRNWVLSLGKVLTAEGEAFDWMGRATGAMTKDHFQIEVPLESAPLQIEYIYKPNGGLYTGYNTAYHLINTELCVCIDSDDWMPDNAVELIVNHWKKYGSDKYAGITGLDFTPEGQPIGGFFPEGLNEACIIGFHKGDTKEVFRTELMKQVSPMIGFEGEKNFNPNYMQIQVADKYPSLILNENLCFVEYQIGKDSMSEAIFRQYVNSARSFAKLRLLQMSISHTSWKRLFCVAIHYNSSCFISHDSNWLSNSPRKFLTIITRPIGWLLTGYIYYKNNH